MHIELFNCRHLLGFQGLGAAYTTFLVVIKHQMSSIKGSNTFQSNIRKGILDSH